MLTSLRHCVEAAALEGETGSDSTTRPTTSRTLGRPRTPAKRARKRGAATAVEAIAGTRPFVVKFGAVRGQGRVIESHDHSGVARHTRALVLATSRKLPPAPLSPKRGWPCQSSASMIRW